MTTWTSHEEQPAVAWRRLADAAKPASTILRHSVVQTDSIRGSLISYSNLQPSHHAAPTSTTYRRRHI